MPAITVGSVEVDVVPNARGIDGRLRAALVPPASQIGDEVGRILGQRIAAQIAPAVRDGIQNGSRAARPAATRQGDETGGAFARSLRAKLEQAFRSMPKLQVSLSDTGVDAELARLRARMETLSNKRIGVDVDVAAADAEIADIEERLRRLGAAHPNVAVRADTAAARAALAEIRAEIDRVTADPARIRLETDGALGTRLRAAVAQAEASLPNINIDADTSPAQAEIASLRAQLTALRDARIGIDIDAGAAMARITEIQARLTRLSSQNADVNVRVDSGAAAAQLAAFQAEVDRLDGRTARVDVDTSSAVGNFSLLTTTATAFGPALIPALSVVAAGLGAIAAAAAAAGAGIGGIALVAVPAFKQISNVLQLQKQAQDAATTATIKGSQAGGQAAQRALQQASAQQALATAQRNGAREIADAQQGVVDAERQAAQANAQAAQQVKAARQALADAYQQAAERMQQANQQVASAERDLAQAQKSERQAQLDLTAARKEAARQLEDMNNQLTDSQLSLRDAQLQVIEAKQNLDSVNAAGSKASGLQRAQAQLQYDEAVQHLKEQQLETKRLQSDTAAANKAGVAGSATVVSAQDKLAQAQQDVVDKTAALKAAQDNVAKTQIQNTRTIADAQEKLSEAQKNVAVTQQQGAEAIAKAQERVVTAQQNAADSIASAQRQIASASLSAAGGVDQAAVAQAKYQQALAKLTPSARDTLNAFVGLRTAFSAWSRALQPAVMPIFTRALVGLRNALPALTPLVLAAARGVGVLQDRVAAGFKSDAFLTLKRDLVANVEPAIVGFGTAILNIFKGMGGVVDAFLPHMDAISAKLQSTTGRFAQWGASLRSSSGFAQFFSYTLQQAPIVGHAIGQLVTAFIHLAVALAPLGGTSISFINALSAAISAIPTPVLSVLGVAFASVVIGARLAALAMGVWKVAQIGAAAVTALLTGETAALNATMEANPIGLVVTLIAALVVALIYAWQHWTAFRVVVLAAWGGIQTAALFVWNTVLKPVLTAIWTGLQTVGRWAMWLWTNAIGPAFRFIWAAAKILLTVLVVAVLLPIIATFKIAAAVGLWLWNTALGPAFRGIAFVAAWLYNNAIKPYFGFIVAEFRFAAKIGAWLWNNALAPAFRGIAGVAMWLYTHGIKPAFSLISSIVSSAWHYGIKPVFDLLKEGVAKVAIAFDVARAGIKLAWDKIKNIARVPAQYVVDVVYNHGIRGVWNEVAGAFGAPKLPEYKFASGGIMPGYTPGRDVHRFVSPTGGALELSGGEAIMRPEFTRAVGSGFVGAMNAIAKSQGAQGVKAALAPVFGGNPNTPTDRSLKYAGGGIVQSFADGGIFGWIKSAGAAIKGAGSAAWNAIKQTASWLGDTLEASARAGVQSVVNPLLAAFPGMDTGFGRMLRRVPDRILNTLFGYSKKADDLGAGGIGGPRIQAALNWAKSQSGLPYQWAGNGDPSWDCSGFMSAIESVIRGEKPHRRWATMAFQGTTAPPGWVYHGNSPFKIGVTNAGVGHTAGTLAGVNVESSGGLGVHYGRTARGYNDKLFPDWYGFQPGKYDTGGWMPPGMNLMFNGLGRPEAVLTPGQWDAIHGAAVRGGDGASAPASFEGNLYLDSGEFLGRVRGEAQQVVNHNNGQLLTALGARPRR